MSSKYKDVLDVYFFSKHSLYHMFLETLGHFHLNGDDSRYHDLHQEYQEVQEMSSKSFLIVSLVSKTLCVIF